MIKKMGRNHHFRHSRHITKFLPIIWYHTISEVGFVGNKHSYIARIDYIFLSSFIRYSHDFLGHVL